MDTAAEPAEVTHTPTPATSPTVPVGRPENTILTIVLMLLLAAGVLYGADWVIRDDETVTQQWDFAAEPLEGGAWHFPGDAVTRTANGIAFEIPKSEVGPELTCSIPAGNARRVRLGGTVMDTASGKTVPFTFALYWARAEDVASAPDAPYSTNRARRFESTARYRPQEFYADMEPHPDWTGTIERIRISVILLPVGPGPYRVTLSHFDVVE